MVESMESVYSGSGSGSGGGRRVVGVVLLVVLVGVVSVFVGVWVGGGGGGDVGGSGGVVGVYEEVRPSVVTVSVVRGENSSVQGSGFVYEGGVVVTNRHVVAGGEEVFVQFARGEWSRARVVGMDVYTDLAVLVPESVPGYADALPVQEGLPERGERVVVVGAPEGLRGSVSVGVVSGTGRAMRTGTGFVIPDMIQTTASLNPGNSGGPLVSMGGEVLGVVNSRQGENLGFAISARVMERVVGEIVGGGGVRHSLLGVRSVGVSPRVASVNGLDVARGVMVVGVLNGTNSVGKFEGVEEWRVVGGERVPVGGDVIVSVDGRRVVDGASLGSYLMRETEPGDVVEVTVLRDGERMTVEVELVARPDVGG